jgi:phosphate starvation-inducible PhoH-like protein
LEKEIKLNEVHPVVIFGSNNSYLPTIEAAFPKLKIVARGNSVKAIGTETDICALEDKLDQIIRFYKSFNRLNEQDLGHILKDVVPKEIAEANKAATLVYGMGGAKISARTKNQKRIVDACDTHDMVFAIGPAGTGKTYTAVALAVRALKLKAVKRIIVTRPAVEAGEHLGFLPGDLKDKLDPFLQPIYDAFQDMIPKDRLEDFMESGVVQIAPLAYMRGRTLDNAFVILDEAQNASFAQLKMFLTRMGKSAQFIVTGDETQIDLPKVHQSGLRRMLQVVDKISGVAVIRLDRKDVVRHPLVEKIIEGIEADEERVKEYKQEEKKNA